MKDKHLYNVLFNTHTVTGITISVALYICFLAGAFSLFQANINKWEVNVKSNITTKVNYDKVLSLMEEKGYPMKNRSIIIQMVDSPLPYIKVLSRPKMGEIDNVEENVSMEIISIKIDAKSYEILDGENSSSTTYLGSFLYDLHHFNQIPSIGSALAGLVALFFLFAIITGVIVHWKKIFTSFFIFRLKGNLKNVWANAHTSLGIIGLPFQFMYAITGAALALIGLAILPSALVLYDGDMEKALGNIVPIYKSTEITNGAIVEMPNINDLEQKAIRDLQLNSPQTSSIHLTNYMDDDALLMIEFQDKLEHVFNNNAHIVYRLKNLSVVEKQTPRQQNYSGVNVFNVLRKLHYGQFGGYFIKTLFFFMALITCFVILSGVMVWLTARENKKYAAKNKFNTNVGALYLGICLGLFPAIAFFFCIAKVFPLSMENRFGIMSYTFFMFWLVFIAYAYISKDRFKINKHALVLTGVMGVFIPILNGFQSGLWFWESLKIGYMDSFFVDISWLLLGVITLTISKTFKFCKEKTEVSLSQTT